MPGLAQRNNQSSNEKSSSYSLSCNNGFWSKHGNDISYSQLQKFWSELSPQARQDLLRIDKQTLLEHARKNMYCSRCNGLLLEVFMQIVMYGKSLQQEIASGQLSAYNSIVLQHQRNIASENLACQDVVEDPSIHLWGGITTTRDGALTLLDCYLHSKSLKGIQSVFDYGRAREKERELLYPDACGGEGRGWMSQGMISYGPYGRGHGTRETCALHTAKLSCDTLVDFWSALTEDTRVSIFRMKEEDFIERLMYRFESKRFCRDCRRNVIREFKELKELKRMRRKTHCTTWFCVADTAFQYEVSNNTIHADWNNAFIDSMGKYHHFEWAVGTGEGKSDILDYENVGMKGSVKVNGLDLGSLNACYITLRAWKLDGRCTELSVKAHALKGEQCVHCRLMVGDGYVSISHGESITRFFEHAEEAEEEEDENSMDKDGNEFDDECSRPQKHAKSPELAREFLLDTATVIFKEQAEKAFREGTALQNAHSVFICLALKLLEERALVACKEIVTLEKQVKLLEEEEKEKREEEERKERKERKRTKEREKKLRRKERLREKDKVNKCSELNETSTPPDLSNEVSQEPDHSMDEVLTESVDPMGYSPASSDIQDVTSPKHYEVSELQNNSAEEDTTIVEDENNSFPVKDSSSLIRESDKHQSTESDSLVYQSESRYCNDSSDYFSRERNRQSRSSAAKLTFRNSTPRSNHKLQCTSNRTADRKDPSFCACNGNNECTVKPHGFTTRFNRQRESLEQVDSSYKLTQNDPHARENCARPKSKIPNNGNHTKKVWEPVASQKRYSCISSDTAVTLKKSENDLCSFEVTHKATNTDRADCKSIGSPDFSASSSSSSDNCSSCLSEGDNNTSSSTSPAQELSSSTSDSEDGSQLSEEKETSSAHTQMPLSENKDTNVAPSKETTPGFVPVTIAPKAGSFIPQILNMQNVHYPYQSPPLMGYYHQNQQISWPSPHGNGLLPYTHANPYLYTTPFSYTLPYGAVQPLQSHVLNATQVPVYPPLLPTNALSHLQEKIPKQAPGNVGEEKTTDLQTGNTGFSLFKFAGPVPRALAGRKPDGERVDDGYLEAVSPDMACDQSCRNEDTKVEEYKLFAASKGMEFSFF